MSKQPKSPAWASKIGFIFATSGAAIGLGNIQRFPYITAQNGGGAFLLLYFICVLLIGLPLVLCELALGRHTATNPVQAFLLKGKKVRRAWQLIGVLATSTAFFILTYYMVAAGWTVGYAVAALKDSYEPLNRFAAQPDQVLLYTLLIHLITTYIVSRGLNSGIEKFSKILMPTLLVLIIGLVIQANSLEGSFAGLEYYLTPDFSKINSYSLVHALSQAFFSLCVGEAVLLTYGGFCRKTDNLVSSAGLIAICDTAIAFLAGLMIFPALFAFGEQPEQGVALIYNIMPKVFSSLAYGRCLGFIFFLILSFAALTTCIALLEVPSHTLHQLTGWPKKKCVWLLSFVAFVLSIPTAFSHGTSHFLTNLSIPGIPAVGYYELMDFIWGGLAMIFSGLLSAIFVGWVWGAKQAQKEIIEGCPSFTFLSPIWAFIVKFVAPAAIVLILFSMF